MEPATSCDQLHKLTRTTEHPPTRQRLASPKTPHNPPELTRLVFAGHAKLHTKPTAAANTGCRPVQCGSQFIAVRVTNHSKPTEDARYIKPQSCRMSCSVHSASIYITPHSNNYSTSHQRVRRLTCTPTNKHQVTHSFPINCPASSDWQH